MLDIVQAKKVADREDEGTTVEIVDEAGNQMDGVTMVVAGSYSKRYRAAQEKARKWSKKNPNPSEEQSDKKILELLASCIIDWDGIVSGNVPVALTIENAVALFEAAPWVRDQVSVAVYNHAAFFQRASAS